MIGMFSRTRSQTASFTNIHVLVIAIEHYESDDLHDLNGVSKTAWSLSHWWRKTEEHGHMLPGRHLASVKTLTSYADSTRTDERLSEDDICALSTSEIETAIVDWASALEQDSVGVLHWIGHGESLGGHGGPLLGLYLPDLVDEKKQILDWENAKRGLRNLPNAPTIWCFIDACRVEPECQTARRQVLPFGSTRRDRGNSSINAFYSTMFRGTSHCSTRIEPSIDDLEEGPVFSNALLLALDRFAATLRNNIDGPAAHASDIEDATQQRMVEWLTNRNILSWQDYIFGEAEPIIERKPGKNHKMPIVASPDPHSMLNVKMLRKRSSNDSCKVFSRNNGVDQESEVPLRKAPNGWNADLSRAVPEHSIYGIQVEQQQRLFSRKGLREKEVFASYPVHSLVLDD